MAFLSVAHRPTVVQFHSVVLKFKWSDDNQTLLSKVVPGYAMAHQLAMTMGGATGVASPKRSMSPRPRVLTRPSFDGSLTPSALTPALTPTPSSPVSNTSIALRESTIPAAHVRRALERHTVTVMERRYFFRNPAMGVIDEDDIDDLDDTNSLQDDVSEASVNVHRRKLIAALARRAQDPDAGFADSDDDENVLARKVMKRTTTNKLVETPYAAVREAESHEKLASTSYRRILRMLAISFGSFFALFLPCMVVLCLAAGKTMEEWLFIAVLSDLRQVIDSQKGDEYVNYDFSSMTTRIVLCCILAVVLSVWQALQNYWFFRIMIRSRRKLVEIIQFMYMQARAKLYFVLNNLDKRVDNVDQRITNDVNMALQYIFEFFFGGILRPQGGFLYNLAYFICLTAFSIVEEKFTKFSGEPRDASKIHGI